MRQVEYGIPDIKNREKSYVFHSSDDEKRLLRIKLFSVENALKKQKIARYDLDQKNKRLEEQLEKEREKNKELEKENAKLRLERDKYKELLFKKNSKSKKELSCNTDGKIHFIEKQRQKKGAQVGHKGKGYQLPKEIDKEQRIYLTHCPECNNKVNRCKSIKRRRVQDIPDLEQIQYKTTEYEIEKQWCGHCQKYVFAQPAGVLPKEHYGINTLLYVMLQKYQAKNSYSSIKFNLDKLFGLKISEGSLAGMLQRASQYLNKEYEKILELIKMEQVKHADETTWRIDGIKHWIWGLFTNRFAYYTVDQSRGKGVIDDLVKNSNPETILVRDDYPAYKNLKFKHQSCWAHLLRESHQLSQAENASKEVKNLHHRLKKYFDKLLLITKSEFNETKRKKAYLKYEAIFQKIIQAKYKCDDTKKIQTRITNQQNNLITALLYENVPLTNNLAERALRPLVITRKISYGSGSPEGAKAHMVNMSIFQTLLLQGKSLLPALKSAMLA